LSSQLSGPVGERLYLHGPVFIGARDHAPAATLDMHALRALARPAQPRPQDLSHLCHPNLPERHASLPSLPVRNEPEDHSRWSINWQTRWSHPRGNNPQQVVPCSWQTTDQTTRRRTPGRPLAVLADGLPAAASRSAGQFLVQPWLPRARRVTTTYRISRHRDSALAHRSLGRSGGAFAFPGPDPDHGLTRKIRDSAGVLMPSTDTASR
jgi:hypothetical protein